MSDCGCQAAKLSLSLGHVERHSSLQKRVNSFLEFLNRHIAGGFMRNKPGWIDYK